MFNYKRFLRALPATTLRDYLTARPFLLPTEFDWTRPETHLIKALIAAIDAADADPRAALILDLQEASELADEAGYRAMLNACPPGATPFAAFEAMDSFAERALWVSWRHPDVFAKALEIRFFDDTALKLETRRTRLAVSRPISLAPDDLRALADTVASFYRGHEGCGEHLEVEVTRRHREGSIQLTLYVEGLTDTRSEFEHGQLQRRRVKPAKEIALVYNESHGVVETAVRGGRKYHEMLLAAFIECLLKVPIRVETLAPEVFRLDRLKHGVSIRGGAELGIAHVRLKKLVLAHADKSAGIVTIEAPTRPITMSALDLANRWLAGDGLAQNEIHIVQATVAIHFSPPTQRRTRRPLYVEFRRNGTIKWGRIAESERALVESLLIEWGLTDPHALPQAKAA